MVRTLRSPESQWLRITRRMPCRSKRTLKLISSASDRSLAFRYESTCAKWIGSSPWQDFNSTTRRSATRKSSRATPSATFLYVTATGTCRSNRTPRSQARRSMPARRWTRATRDPEHGGPPLRRRPRWGQSRRVHHRVQAAWRLRGLGGSRLRYRTAWLAVAVHSRIFVRRSNAFHHHRFPRRAVLTFVQPASLNRKAHDVRAIGESKFFHGARFVSLEGARAELQIRSDPLHRVTQ